MRYFTFNFDGILENGPKKWAKSKRLIAKMLQSKKKSLMESCFGQK